ncbi:hypothetical protein DFR33_11435 [Bradymonas sediminis]|nr:hypothetical protein DFR33_11435 [Bradymonas sediminis]
MFLIHGACSLGLSKGRPRRFLLHSFVAASAMVVGCASQAPESVAVDPATPVSEVRAASAPQEASSEADSRQMEWFSGADALPEGHPCHDDTPVVYAWMAADYPDRQGSGEMWTFELDTVGGLSERLGPEDRAYFRSREVRGVRWSDPSGAHLVVSCNLVGKALAAFDGNALMEAPQLDVEGAQFILGYSNESSGAQRGGLRHMHRGEDGQWRILSERVLWSSISEVYHPEYTALAGVVAAQDADANELPEVVAFTVRNAQSSEAQPAESVCLDAGDGSECAYFEVQIIASEGEHEMVQRVALRLDASLAGTDEIAGGEAMSAKAAATLAAAIEAQRPAVVERATEMLRAAKKIADKP